MIFLRDSGDMTALEHVMQFLPPHPPSYPTPFLTPNIAHLTHFKISYH